MFKRNDKIKSDEFVCVIGERMKEYILENANWQHIIIYLIGINILGFIAMGWDKWKAQRGDWRTPEKTLMSICLLGGGIRYYSWNVYFQT